MSTIPARVAQVAIVETDVLGAKAHHAQCQVPGCHWSTRRFDARKDGQPVKAVLDAGTKHAHTHTDAQDALDTQGDTL